MKLTAHSNGSLWDKIAILLDNPYIRAVIWIPVGILLAIAVLVASETSFTELQEENDRILQSMDMSLALATLLAQISTAEAGQRGYLLTGEKKYLEPYRAAIANVNRTFNTIRMKGRGIPGGDKRVELLRLVGEKIGEMDATLALDTLHGREMALQLVLSNVGLKRMEHITELIDSMQVERTQWAEQHARAWDRLAIWARSSLIVLASLTIVMIVLAGRRSIHELKLQDRIIEEANAHRNELEDQVKERTSELSNLASSLQRVQEEERAKLARELHDELGGILTSAKMGLSMTLRKLGTLSEGGDPATLQEQIRKIMQSMDEGISVKRRLIEDLRPSALQHLGLATTLRGYVEEVCKRAGVSLTHQIEDIPDLPDSVMITIYRVVQESLTNAFKHSGAKRIEVQLRRIDTGIIATVQDNGKGFNPKEISVFKRYGLAGMRQRASALDGRVDISTQPNVGTAVRIFIPEHRLTESMQTV